MIDGACKVVVEGEACTQLDELISCRDPLRPGYAFLTGA